MSGNSLKEETKELDSAQPDSEKNESQLDATQEERDPLELHLDSSQEEERDPLGLHSAPHYYHSYCNDSSQEDQGAKSELDATQEEVGESDLDGTQEDRQPELDSTQEENDAKSKLDATQESDLDGTQESVLGKGDAAEEEVKEIERVLEEGSKDLVETYMFRLPRSYEFGDYIWPGILMSPSRLQMMQDLTFRPTDIIIASYPKSGTTWVSEIVSLVVCGGDVEKVNSVPQHQRVPWMEMENGFLWVKVFHLYSLFSKLVGLGPSSDSKEEKEAPRLFFTHLPLELFPTQALEGGCKIIYVARNPKDNAVSFFHFHQMARFLGLQKTPWEEFFTLYTTGHIYSGSWFEHVLSFWKLKSINPNVLFLKYEDMKRDLDSEVKKISEFVGVSLGEKERSRVVDHCSFHSMKDNKMANREGVWLFNQSVSKFMRKGVVGDWENYFTVAQDKIFDKIYSHRMKDSGLHFTFHP